MIKIRSIALNAIEPFGRKTNYDLEKINLIYGKNESGKSFFVRSLLGSIFRTEKRDKYGLKEAKVLLTTAENDIIELSGGNKACIEHQISNTADNVINDLSRLCLVAEGDLTLDNDNRNSITVETLRGYFSDTKARNELHERAKKGIQNGSIQPTGPSGNQGGAEIKLRDAEKTYITKIDNFLGDVNRTYPAAQLQAIDQELENLDTQIDAMDLAKRASAWKTKQELENQRLFSSTYSLESIIEAQSQISKLERDQREYNELTVAVSKDGDPSAELDWLNNAERVLSMSDSPAKPLIDKTVFGIAILLLIGLLASISFTQLVASLIFAVLLFVVLIYVLMNQNRSDSDIIAADQNQKIYQEFSERYNIKNPTIVDVRTMMKSIEKSSLEIANSRNNLQQLEVKISEAKTYLSDLFIQLSIPPTDNYESIKPQLEELRSKHKSAYTEESRLNLRLGSLGFESKDIDEVHSDLQYDNSEETRLIDAKSKLGTQKSNLLDSHKGLLQVGHGIINTGEKPDWNETLDQMQVLRATHVENLRKKNAEIIAKIIIDKYLTEQIEQEDNIIQKALANSLINKYLHAFTEKYTGLVYEDNDIFVMPQHIHINQLSTGTKEQILLAIRFGILQHHLGDQQMFIILDDAFQHSDWDRRKPLVDALGSLASMGWQILYFTMDDNIRQLFEERIAPKFGKDFKLFELSNN